MTKDMVVLLAARAARMENQDAIDAAIVNMLADPKEVTLFWIEVFFNYLLTWTNSTIVVLTE